MNLLHKNFIYNNLLSLTNVLVPIIIFPYVSKILGPSGIGTVSFAISLTAIFVIIGSLGIPIYGIREIAKVKSNKKVLSKVFSELICIQLFWMCITFIIYAFWLIFTDTFKNEEIIKYASFLHILGLIGMINWFFQGIENYKFITIVNFIMKVCTLVLLYCLLKQENEYWLYYIIMVGVTVLGAFISVIYALKFVSISFKNLNLKPHFKSIFILFSTQLAIGIYINLDIIFLNYFSSDIQVGLYTPASKLVKLCVLIVTSLGTVLIPKISLYIKEGKQDESIQIINKSLQFIFLISFPITILLATLSKEIIHIFAGSEFSYSATLLVFLSPIIFLIGLSNVFGLQILVPTHKENKLMIAVLIGAVVSIILNIILIPKLASKGAAVSIIITELVITILTFYSAKKELNFQVPVKKMIIYLFLSLLIIPICVGLQIILNGKIYVFISLLVSSFMYVFGLLLIKDQFFIQNIWNPILKLKK